MALASPVRRSQSVTSIHEDFMRPPRIRERIGHDKIKYFMAA